MFKLIGDGGSLAVKSHVGLEDHLMEMGIGLEEVNFFKWEALPNRSYGRFIVSEREWLGRNIEAGSVTFTLEIEDQHGLKTFDGLELIRTFFIMSPNKNADQDGARHLIVELELTKNKYHSGNRIVENFEDFDALEDEYETAGYFKEPTYYNKWPIPDVPLIDYLAYLADTHFLTCYLPAEGADVKPELTSTLFDFDNVSLYSRLLYNEVAINVTSDFFKVKLQSNSKCKSEFLESELTEIVYDTDEYFYESEVASNTERDDINVFIPYALYDHAATTPPDADDFASWIVENAKTRLLRSIDMIYEGVVNGDLSADVQSITYYFSEYGLRTRLRTIPWTVRNCVLAPRNEKCKDAVYSAFLIEDMTCNDDECEALAFVTKIREITTIIEEEVTIYDPLKLWETLNKGTRVYVTKECETCNYIIIQGPCPPGQLGEVAACCITFDTEGGDPVDLCYDLQESVCDKLGGVWHLTASCADETDPCAIPESAGEGGGSGLLSMSATGGGVSGPPTEEES
jgi:hypothetical protein